MLSWRTAGAPPDGPIKHPDLRSRAQRKGDDEDDDFFDPVAASNQKRAAGDAALGKGQLQAAVRFYNEAIDFDDNNPRNFGQRAIARRKLGAFEFMSIPSD